MKNNKNRLRRHLDHLFGFLPLFFIVLACNLSQDYDKSKSESDKSDKKSDSKKAAGKRGETKTDFAKDDLNNSRVEICKRYEDCDCQTYESCRQQLENDPTPDEPGIKECILNSSCESLCAGKPDGCPNRKNNAPMKSNCAAISCGKNSDCPGDCHGGCDGVRCYSF